VCHFYGHNVPCVAQVPRVHNQCSAWRLNPISDIFPAISSTQVFETNVLMYDVGQTCVLYIVLLFDITESLLPGYAASTTSRAWMQTYLPSHQHSKVKVKLSLCFNWAPCHGGVLGECRYSSTHSLTSALDGGEWSASCPGRFTPRERTPGTHWIGGLFSHDP
jgi:hypothetical protein